MAAACDVSVTITVLSYSVFNEMEDGQVPYKTFLRLELS